MLSHHSVISGVQFNTPDGFHLYRDTASFFFLQLIGHSRAIHSAHSHSYCRLFIIVPEKKNETNKSLKKDHQSLIINAVVSSSFYLPSP